jgi:ubiquinol-cytochrome c reductase cytochrome c subunit
VTVRRLGTCAVVLALTALLATTALAGAESPVAGPSEARAGPGADDVRDPAQVSRGKELYLTSCVSCHGLEGAGTENGPPLLTAGEAAADFYLRTGRMPLAAPAPQPPDKPRAYDDDEIEALVAYVGSLGDGPPIPDVDPERGDLAVGGELFRANCAACHNASAIGGALSHGNYAPSLHGTAPLQVGEAMRVGPGQMPRFGPDVFTEQELDSIVRYVQYLHTPEDPGGLNLGYTGPVPEGFVAFLFGLAGLIVVAFWITRERRTDG